MSIRIGIGVDVGRSGGGFISQYESVLNRALVLGYALPIEAVQILQNSFIKGLVESGIFAKLDHLKIYAGSNENFSLINFINPSIRLSTRVNSPTYGYAYGFKGNATNAHLETGFIISETDNYKLNDCCYFRYRKTENTVGQTQNYMGSYNAAGSIYLGSYGANNYDIALNGSGSVSTAGSGGTTGLHLIKRDNSTQIKNYLNGSLNQTTASTSTAIPNNEFLTLKLNITSSSDAEISMEGAGSSLSDGEITILSDLVTTYINSI